MLKQLCLTTALLLGLFFQPTTSRADDITPTEQSASQRYVIEGMINRTTPEGGCFYLDSAGARYHLTGRAEDLEQVLRLGQEVRLVVEPDPTAVTACEEGPALKILQVLKVEKPMNVTRPYKSRHRGEAFV
jgi:hypothetical protein